METPSTPAPATPASAESPALAYKPGETDHEFVARVSREKAEGATKAEPPAAEPVAQPETPAAPEAKAEPATQPEEPAQPEELTDEQKQILEQVESELLASAEAEGVLSPKALAENPDLKPILEKNPEFKGQLMKTARLASEAAKYQELFNTPEQAATAHELATSFAPLRESFQAIQQPDDARNVLKQIADLSVVTDEQGNPVLENGKPVIHESFATFLDGVFAQVLGFEQKRMQAGVEPGPAASAAALAVLEFERSRLQKEADKGDEDAQGLLAALDTLKERISPARSQASEEIPEHVKQRQADLDRREQELNRQQQEARQQATLAFEEKFNTAIDKSVVPLIDRILDKMAVPDFNRDTAKARIVEDLGDRLLANQHYVSAAKALKGKGISDDVLKQRVALAMRNVQEILADVARPIITEAKGSFKKSQDAKSAKLASQIEASRSEPKGGTAAPTPAPVPKKHEQLAEFRRQYRQQLGEMPTDREEVAFVTGKPIHGFKWQTSA